MTAQTAAQQLAVAVVVVAIISIVSTAVRISTSANRLGNSDRHAAPPSLELQRGPNRAGASTFRTGRGDEICPGPGEWSSTGVRSDDDGVVRAKMVWRADGCSTALRRDGSQSGASAAALRSTAFRLKHIYSDTRSMATAATAAPAEEVLKVLLLGDSTMNRLYYQGFAHAVCQHGRQVLAKEQRCSFLDFLKLSESLPRRAHHGVNRSLCCGAFDIDRVDSDDGGPRLCNPWGLKHDGIAERVLCPAASLDIELVPITKCEDRLRQSALVAYRSPEAYDYLIINCGLHSSGSVAQPNTTTADGYVLALREYLELVAPLARHVVWLTNSRTLDSECLPCS